MTFGDGDGNARDWNGMMEKYPGRGLSRGRRAFGAGVGDGGWGAWLNCASREGRASRKRPREVFAGVNAVDARARV